MHPDCCNECFDVSHDDECTCHGCDPDLGGVYFIHPFGSDSVKIGYSTRIWRRLHQLQGANSSELILVGYIPYAEKSREREVHAEFEHLRIQREWFKLGDEVWAWMEATPDVYVVGEEEP